MRNTVYALAKNPDMAAIKAAVFKVADSMRKYVPGYKIILGPIYENGRITVTIEVRGRGDFLPVYAGNLDIITCAALEIAENYARKKLL